MLSEEFLFAGMAALCGVDVDHLNEKHWGAALLAAYFLAADHDLDVDASDAMARQLRELQASQSRWFPPAATSPVGDPSDVLAALDVAIGRLTMLGHGTIFATLGLRAMNECPALATAANVAGLVATVQRAATRGPGGPFPAWPDPGGVTVEPNDAVASLTTPAELAIETARAFGRVGTVYAGLDQGVVHHVLTHAHALLQLEALGHADTARKGRSAQRTYIKLLSRRPVTGERPLPMAPTSVVDVRSVQYWRQPLRGDGEWLFGHVFKVPFAWFPIAAFLDPAERVELEAFLVGTLAVATTT